MEYGKPHKLRLLLTRGIGLLALPVALSAVVGMATVKSPAELQAVASYQAQSQQDETTTTRLQETLQQATTGSDTQVASDWSNASPEVYARIALAFNTEAMAGADLNRVECRNSLCRVVYEAAPELQVRHVLPRQLAETFNSMVTVHSGRNNGTESLVYLDIPASS